MADGPLTALFNLAGTTDSNGNLLVTGGTYAGPDSPAQSAYNLRGRVDATNALIVVFK